MKKRIKNSIIKRIPVLRKNFFYTHTYEGIRLSSMLIHNINNGYPEPRGEIVPDIEPTKEDEKITRRIVKAYKNELSQRKYNNRKKDMWNFLEHKFYKHFISLLENERIDELSFMLCNMSRLDITEGLIQGTNAYNNIRKYSTQKRWYLLATLDKLTALAESIGILAYENPEQGKYGENIFSDSEDLITKIEKKLKIRIVPPKVEGGLFQLVTNKGNIHNRDIMSLYTALRVKEIVQGNKKAHICEIGAGIGKGAYYAYLLGLKRYTIIDLPHINVLQGYYLLKCLPKSPIFLSGEYKKDANEGIFILSDRTFSDYSNNEFTLTLNQDSFPEIDKNTVKTYLRQISKNTSDYFLSINQESKNTMVVGKKTQNYLPDLINEIPVFKRRYRMPYWLREGYIEELYRLNK